MIPFDLASPTLAFPTLTSPMLVPLAGGPRLVGATFRCRAPARLGRGHLLVHLPARSCVSSWPLPV